MGPTRGRELWALNRHLRVGPLPFSAAESGVCIQICARPICPSSKGTAVAQARGQPQVPGSLVLLGMFGTKPGITKGSAQDSLSPRTSSCPGALPHRPRRETDVPQGQQAEVGAVPGHLPPGAEHGERAGEGGQHHLPPPPTVYSNKHVLLPLPLAGLWFGLNPSLQVDTPGRQAVDRDGKGVGIGVPGRHVQTLYLYI